VDIQFREVGRLGRKLSSKRIVSGHAVQGSRIDWEEVVQLRELLVNIQFWELGMTGNKTCMANRIISGFVE
jgi:hypothetical protein